MADDGFCGHGFFFDFPTVVIRDHGQCREGDLGLAGEFGLGQVGHADDIETKLAMRIGLCPRGESGAIHANVGAAVVNAAALCHGGVMQQCPQFVGDGVAKGHVANDASAKEGVLITATGAIEELVW